MLSLHCISASVNAPLSVSIASLVALVVSTLKCVNIYVSGVAGEKSSVVALLHEVDTLQSILSTLDELGVYYRALVHLLFKKL